MKILNIIESLNTQIPYRWIIQSDKNWWGEFTIGANEYFVEISEYLDGDDGDKAYWNIGFEALTSKYELTDNKEEFKVFSTVIKMIEEFVIKVKPARLTFSGDKKTMGGRETSRVSLYRRMVNRFGKRHGYKVRESNKSNISVKFVLER